jgi:CRISPR-associated protein Csy2
MTEPEALLVLPRLRVQNANAISSPLTWGFPSPSAFTGFVHALHRDLHAELDLDLDGVGIVCHEFEPQASAPSGRRNRVFHLTRNPITKDGKTASIVEEGRTHLTVSLLIGVSGAGLYCGTSPETIAERAYQAACSRRLAGGSILEPTSPSTRRGVPELHLWPGTDEESRRFNKRLAQRLLPGFALVSREALLDQHWQSLRETAPATTLLEALLDLSGLNIEPGGTGSPAASERATAAGGGALPEKVEWGVRRRSGWLVPIAAGYNALSGLNDPGAVKNARDRTVPFRFVEGLYTVGQWLSPHRVEDLRQLLWFHEADPVAGVYRWTTPHFASSIDQEGN